ncbi:hypothetical protein CMO93_02895 [Candidatus Woesearchaeota archaeon]|nr:hypothetical protein [Candidatus Woesearchaeota archaeon]|tara:strand:- start:278 stop:1375 length:1098 start_codon:yes stop_codon:yes gene_type:complete
MKLLFLAKRFGSGKDAILEDFGRQVRLAENLVKLGNEVHLIAADYIEKRTFEKTLHGIKVVVIPFGLFSFSSYISRLRKKIRKESYDAIIASSDPIFGIIAYIIAQKTPIIYDVQDNYFSYTSYKFPFVRFFEKKVLKRAVLVTTVSNSLLNHIKKVNKKCILVKNGIDSKKIKPIDKFESRKKYNLPIESTIIAYSARYVDVNQKLAIDFLVKNYNILKKKHKNLYLLLIGEGNPSRIKKDKDNKGIISFESLSHDKLIELLSSADILTIPYVLTPFTEFSFPYKLSEYMVFSKPVVCSDIGEMKTLMKPHPQLLFKQNNSEDFIKKIELALKIKNVDYSQQLKDLTWNKITKKLHNAVHGALK